MRKEGVAVLVAALTASMALAAGCATETGRGTLGGLVYGSMVGTSIAPGIGSAIGAGVGMVAGAIEGTQKEEVEKAREEAYRRAFYPTEGEISRTAAARREGAPFSSESGQASDSFSNLLALQDDQPIVSMLEREVHETESPGRVAGKPEAEAVAMASDVANLYQELSEVRRERSDLEARVGLLAALLEEYDRSGRTSKALLEKMEEALGRPPRNDVASPAGQESPELLYLQQEYEIALRIGNAPLAEALARRFERLAGRRPHRSPLSSPPPLPTRR
ncbi:MAG: hypothetical protein IH828_10310 [Nitrospinae bacterium]|nr:hypothetical protein [Nitrospinota bacterium]